MFGTTVDGLVLTLVRLGGGCTNNWVREVIVWPLRVAESRTEVSLVTGCVVIVNVPLVDPAGSVGLAGGDATEGLKLPRPTTVPPAGAGKVSCTVPWAGLPPYVDGEGELIQRRRGQLVHYVNGEGGAVAERAAGRCHCQREVAQGRGAVRAQLERSVRAIDGRAKIGVQDGVIGDGGGGGRLRGDALWQVAELEVHRAAKAGVGITRSHHDRGVVPEKARRGRVPLRGDELRLGQSSRAIVVESQVCSPPRTR
jgi:hypothetical protein